jgi:hypothetical protein
VSAEGIASCKTLEEEPPASQQSEALDRFQGIRRTGRRVPAGGGRQGRDALPVEVDPPDHEPSKHSRSVSRVSSSRRSGKEASYARGRARISRSMTHPRSRSRGRRTMRPISFRRRRSRFRSTTVLPYRGTIVPRRGTVPDEGALNTSSHSPRPRLPSRRSPRISLPRRTRISRGSCSPSGATPPRRGAPTERYFEPTFTVSRLRPCRRRRFSASRPPRVFILARKPCLFSRFRFLGL